VRWLGGLQLRTRVAIIASFAVALAVVVVAVAAFVVTRSQLLSQIDESLEARVTQFGPGPLLDLIDAGRRRIPGGPGEFDALYVQLVAASGESLALPGAALELPVEQLDIDIAARRAPRATRTVTVAGVRLRLHTAPLRFEGRRALLGNTDDIAVQVARSLGEVESSLSRLGWALVLGGGLGVAGAAGLGLVVARSALRPIEQLTAAAESVAETQDLESQIDVTGDDEVGRLAVAFNDMLGALNESRMQQRRLVRDASHELRTPLTALRTNIEMLTHAGDLDEDDRRGLIDDVTHEVEELGALVAELVELATDTDIDEVVTSVDLGDVAEAVADRYRRRTGRSVTVEGAVDPIEARAGAMERAVRNLVDNATKWGDPGHPVVVSVAQNASEVSVAVSDEGPGIAPADRERVFERFYRADAARSMPGSGLGLAIVARIVRDHGGGTFVDETSGGGAVVGFTLPRGGGQT
jgi:two-component system sensor histidine kinase MprB